MEQSLELAIWWSSNPKTQRILRTNFHQAVDEYLEFCKEIGKDPQKE